MESRSINAGSAKSVRYITARDVVRGAVQPSVRQKFPNHIGHRLRPEWRWNITPPHIQENLLCSDHSAPSDPCSPRSELSSSPFPPNRCPERARARPPVHSRVCPADPPSSHPFRQINSALPIGLHAGALCPLSWPEHPRLRRCSQLPFWHVNTELRVAAPAYDSSTTSAYGHRDVRCSRVQR